MVRVDVRVEDVAQPEFTLAQQSIVRFRIASRVNDCRLTCPARGDHVGGTPAPFVENLLEIHDRRSSFLFRSGRAAGAYSSRMASSFERASHSARDRHL